MKVVALILIFDAVSQMEHGILHLADRECPRVMVLVDCEGFSPLRLPMQMRRSCALPFQDNFPLSWQFICHTASSCNTDDAANSYESELLASILSRIVLICFFLLR